MSRKFKNSQYSQKWSIQSKPDKKQQKNGQKRSKTVKLVMVFGCLPWCQEGLPWCQKGLSGCQECLPGCQEGLPWCQEGLPWCQECLPWRQEGLPSCQEGLPWCQDGLPRCLEGDRKVNHGVRQVCYGHGRSGLLKGFPKTYHTLGAETLYHPPHQAQPSSQQLALYSLVGPSPLLAS